MNEQKSIRNTQTDSYGNTSYEVKQMEIWRDIQGYDGLYQVSSWGRVRSWYSCILHPEVTKKGYLRVDLYDADGNRKHKKVHRLVANAFIPNSDGKPQVNHKDGNKKNNSVTNLEWVTDAENKDHRKELLDV